MTISLTLSLSPDTYREFQTRELHPIVVGIHRHLLTGLLLVSFFSCQYFVSLSHFCTLLLQSSFDATYYGTSLTSASHCLRITASANTDVADNCIICIDSPDSILLIQWRERESDSHDMVAGRDSTSPRGSCPFSLTSASASSSVHVSG